MRWILLALGVSASCTLITGALHKCGDGFIQDDEETCDDGNPFDEDGCSSVCQTESTCGNGIIEFVEECDDGDLADNSRCKSDCTIPKITQIASGAAHTCALDELGSIHCWGEGALGALGYGNINNVGDDETPILEPLELGSLQVEGLGLSAGASHNCILANDTEIACWGDNSVGQLGYGNTITIGDSEDAGFEGEVDFGGSAVGVVAGGSHTCALLDDNRVKCWGLNSEGQLGQGNTTSLGGSGSFSGVSPVNLGNIEVEKIAAGGSHNCVITGSGGVRCWGAGFNGQLGNGSNLNIGDNPNETSNIQDLVFIQGGNAAQITAGKLHSCALLDNNQLFCWGDSSSGQLGLGRSGGLGDDEPITGVSAVSFGTINGDITQISAGAVHTCVLFGDGTVKCWGDNSSGQLGKPDLGTFGDEPGETPGSLTAIKLDEAVIQVSAGGDHTCVLTLSGRVRCWGDASEGQLGTGNTTDILDALLSDDILLF